MVKGDFDHHVGGTFDVSKSSGRLKICQTNFGLTSHKAYQIEISKRMLFIALSVIFFRLPSRKFTLGYITRHGVLRPNATGCVTVCCILYDIFAIIGLGMQLAIDYGISNPEAKVLIPGLKYVVIWIGVWCFCWSTACQYICARWDPPWQSDSSDRKLNIVPFPVIVTLNITFVGVAIVGVAIIGAVFSFANNQYIKLQRAVDSIETLLSDLNMMQADAASIFDVLSTLPGQPLRKIDHQIHRFSYWLRIRILTCLGLNSCLLIVYTPFIFFTYIQLKKFIRFAPREWAESKKGPQKHYPGRKRGSRIDCKKEMKSLLLTAGTIYSVLLVEAPLLVWEFMHISAGNCRSSEGVVIREMASDVIVSIIGNLLIGCVLAQTIRILQPQLRDLCWCLGRTRSGGPGRDNHMLRSNNWQPGINIKKLKGPIGQFPVKELTVSVLRVTQSQASEPLEQPNFDLLHNWTQKKTTHEEVIQHHLDLDSALDPQLGDEKELEMDHLRPDPMYDRLGG
ncbi:hypothetical protein O181_058575 [Austropuccinia psidii MF-1]|uniref:Uncharacterized protein n=1 Tax=Austropuccinia psidii MF-1 TaxID=1389203 RepID=A0A9Q3HXZ5_9BASI|nr:hypothetical protein [Austropuccinia psidii MF-1]